MFRSARFACMLGAVALVSLLAAPMCRADDGGGGSDKGFFQNWFDMATRTQNEQPHWMTPLVTVTPRLEQEFRYDQFFQQLPTGANLTSYGGGKGVELIPSERTEVILGIPPYQDRTGKTSASGFADWPSFLVKYRLVSANEQEGNYIVTAFLQMSAPTGVEAFTNNAYIIQPTLAFGKGWGDFDIQATVSQQYPVGGSTMVERNFGYPVLTNVAFQYHPWETMWPEFEINHTWWPDGVREGKNQIYLTPGIIFGRFPIYERVKLIVGAGYQFAVSPKVPGFNNNVVLTMRTTF